MRQIKYFLVTLILAILVTALYWKFLSNPIFFDDVNFFQDEGGGQLPIDHAYFSFYQLRSLPYATLRWTKEIFGLDLLYFRAGNLFIHCLNLGVLCFLLKTIFLVTYTPKNKNAFSAEEAALLATALFSLHPVATYAVGYLVQRTILMAMLFSLVTLLIYSHAYLKKNRAGLWLSVPFYYLALFSKEHVIMLFAIILALSVLLDADWRKRLSGEWGALAVMFVISIFVLVSRKELIGTVYEVEGKRLLGTDLGGLVYPLSFITQCGLFFKYVMLWMLPNINWMSIDMRESFVASIWSLHLVGVLLFIAWGVTAIILLLKRGNKGLVGFSMFFPWILFFTELVTVRIQEPFVLYRSYIWAVGGFFSIPVLLSNLEKRTVAVVSIVILSVFSILSMERLVTMSQPILLWEDATKLVEGRSNINGVDRMYYNLGLYYLKSDMFIEAEGNLKKAIAANPDFSGAHAALGKAYNLTHQWHDAVSEFTLAEGIDRKAGQLPTWKYFDGRARAHEGAGELKDAAADYAEACRLNINICDELQRLASQK